MREREVGMRWKRVKGAEHTAEGDQTTGGEHTVPYADDGL